MNLAAAALSPRTRMGLGLSAGLIGAWLITTLGCLGLNCDQLPLGLLIAAVALRTLLQTGLFIVGHDAMHGLLWPGAPRLNDGLGTLALLLYAALPYAHCRVNHQRHHRAPASALDPDVPADREVGILAWFWQFMAGYLRPGQMAALLAGWAAASGLFAFVTPTAALNVLLFGTLPLLLSALQLFVVGTYLPHRQQGHPHGRAHPESLDLPPWLSFLACFHFGYHREHHDHPELPWFALPAAHRNAKRLALPGQPR